MFFFIFFDDARYIFADSLRQFEHIYAIGLKERTDKRDFLNLAASIAGFRVEWIDGVHPEDMSEKALLNVCCFVPRTLRLINTVFRITY